MFSRGNSANAGAQKAKPAPSESTALVPTASGGSGSDLRSRIASKNSGPSIIAADLHIVGNISTAGELHVDGRVDGDITGKALTIGESGEVNGHVETEEVVVHGAVNGTVRAKKVHFARNCQVSADVAHESISIDEGAAFEGQIKRVDNALDAPAGYDHLG